MALITPELFDKLTGNSLGKRDRHFVYVNGALAWGAIGYLVYISKDPALHLLVAGGLLWLIALLIVVFVTAGAVKRGQAGNIVKVAVPAAPAPSPVEINVGTSEGAPALPATPAIAADVKEVKKDVKIVRADVKEVKEQTKKDTAVAVGAVVKEIKKEVVKAVKASKK